MVARRNHYSPCFHLNKVSNPAAKEHETVADKLGFDLADDESSIWYLSSSNVIKRNWQIWLLYCKKNVPKKKLVEVNSWLGMAIGQDLKLLDLSYCPGLQFTLPSWCRAKILDPRPVIWVSIMPYLTRRAMSYLLYLLYYFIFNCFLLNKSTYLPSMLMKINNFFILLELKIFGVVYILKLYLKWEIN